MRAWLYRRGLIHSPSAALVYHKGTLLHPGKAIWALPPDLYGVWKSQQEFMEER